jgi:hypothetical protein
MCTWAHSFTGYTLQTLPPDGRCYYVTPEPLGQDSEPRWRSWAGRGDSLGVFDELVDAQARCERHYREML